MKGIPFDSNTSEEGWDRFRALLDEQVAWPDSYIFKFIVPKKQIDRIRDVFEGEEVVVRASTRGNYLSLTVTLHMGSADEVIAIYRRAGAIDGLISL